MTSSCIADFIQPAVLRPAQKITTQYAADMIVNPSGAASRVLSNRGINLAARDCLRGRESHQATLNQMRVSLGLPAYNTTSDIGGGKGFEEHQLLHLYGAGGVENVDFFVGALAESGHYKMPDGTVVDSSIGETFSAVWQLQMDEIRLKQQQYYTRADASATFTPTILQEIERWTIADIILNTTMTRCVGTNGFKVPRYESNPLRCKPGSDASSFMASIQSAASSVDDAAATAAAAVANAPPVVEKEEKTAFEDAAPVVAIVLSSVSVGLTAFLVLLMTGFGARSKLKSGGESETAPLLATANGAIGTRGTLRSRGAVATASNNYL